jgi:hypothetical protein
MGIGVWRQMSRFPTRRVIRALGSKSETLAGAIGGALHGPGSTAFDDAAETLRLKAALRRAVAKSDAPAYLIDAIRREIRK